MNTLLTSQAKVLLGALCALGALTLLPLDARAQQHFGLYDQMLHITRQELFLGAAQTFVEGDILSFAADQIVVEKGKTIDPASLGRLLAGDTDVCVEQGLEYAACVQVAEKAEGVVRREEGIRALGRDLQLIASGFEEPVLGNDTQTFMARIHGIARMWGADAESEGEEEREEDVLVRKLLLRIRQVDEPSVNEPLAKVGGILSGLAGRQANAESASELIAAAWRYRFAGVRWLRQLRPELPPPPESILQTAAGSEREHLRKRWPELEEALVDLWEALNALEDEDTKPAAGESLYFTFPQEFFAGFPNGIRVWAFVERLPDGSIGGDAGLFLIRAVEPVFPTLCADGGCNRGGAYPPPPVLEEQRALCTTPLMRAGYLCSRPTGESSSICKETPDADPTSIQIAACEGKEGTENEREEQTPEEIESENVCTPLRETSYANTIGNTVRFMNRCWRQSLRDHRMIPGRAPITAGDSAFPFDACMRDDPLLGAIIPAESQEAEWLAPPYRPALLLRHLEETLCPGLPADSPLCMFDPARRLDLPLTNLAELGEDLVRQGGEFAESSLALRQMSEAVGIRIGTRLYNDFLRRKARALTDMTITAAATLEQFTKAKFPAALCPMSDLHGEGLLGTQLCGGGVSAPQSTDDSFEFSE